MHRVLLLLALVTLALAGCASNQPGASPTSAPAASSHPPQGIAVGEPNPGQPGGMHGGALVRPAHVENTTSARGTLKLVGDEDRSGFARGGSVTLSFVATNLGGNASVVGPICDNHPYAFHLRDANGTEHPLQAPQVHCMAIGYQDFAAGAQYAFNLTWDGTYAVGDAMQQAPQGAYTITAVFQALYGADHSVQDEVAVAMPVSIVGFGAQ